MALFLWSAMIDLYHCQVTIVLYHWHVTMAVQYDHVIQRNYNSWPNCKYPWPAVHDQLTSDQSPEPDMKVGDHRKA